jgi:hypothetical protein
LQTECTLEMEAWSSCKMSVIFTHQQGIVSQKTRIINTLAVRI